MIAYDSWKLASAEWSFTPFLLEMEATVWAMEHFHTYLQGKSFTLLTDQKPLTKLGKT